CGYSPLHQAATEGHEEVVRLLCKHNCLVDIQDEMHGNTALHEAAWKGYSRTIEILCKNKANVYIKNKGGFSPLHLACQNGHNQSTRILLLAGCKPDIKNNYGDTPLHTASRYGHAGVLRILISAFCNASEVNKNGDSGLHITAAMGRRKLTRILLEAGCDPTITNKQGETALDIARRKEFNEVADLIEHPPPQVIQLDTSSSPLDQSKDTKKRDKESGTSQGSKDSSHNKPGCRRDKNKKNKHGHKVHFDDEKKKDRKGKLSPYGCHQTPNLGAFPSPKLETLPAEPLGKGEQYFLDLAGNIRKGPVGKGYTCYCAPFFHNVEKKLEADKQELIDHIDHAHEDLNAKIAHLERKTRNQLFNLNQSVREKLAAEKTECQERVERVALRERLERERRQEAQHSELRNELQGYVRERVTQVNYRCSPLGQSSDCKNRFSEVPHWSHLPRRFRPNGVCGGVTRAKSEEVLRDFNGADGLDEEELATNDRALNVRVPPMQAPPPSGLFGNEVGLPPPPAHLASRVAGGSRPDFEKLGAKPKYPLWEHAGERTSPAALLVQQQPSPPGCRGELDARRSPGDQPSPVTVRGFKTNGDLTTKFKKEDFQDEEKEREEVSPNHSPSPPVTANGTCGGGLRQSPKPISNGDVPSAHTPAPQATTTTSTTPPPTQPKPGKPPLMPRPMYPPPYSSHMHRFPTPSSQARPLRVSYGPSPSEVAATPGADTVSGYYNGGAAYASANGGAVEDQLCKLNEGLSLDGENGCPSSEV
ncbi:hypothetical protein V5799_016175, partial [Amblyomma americanum]